MKIKVIAIFLAVILIFTALIALSKFNDNLFESIPSGNSSSSNPSLDNDDTEFTWFGAKLPGSNQIFFNDFSSDDDLNNSYISLSNLNSAVARIDDGSLYFTHRDLEGDKGYISFDPAVKQYDVITFDFDLQISFPSSRAEEDGYLPGLVFFLGDISNQYHLSLTDRYGSEFAESGASYFEKNFCFTQEYDNEEYSQLVTEINADSSDLLHFTIIIYDNVLNIYINGFYVLQFSHILSFDVSPALSFLLYSPYDNSSEQLVINIDNIEMVTYGDGSGSYSGVLNTYKNNSLDILDLFGGKK